MSERTWWPQQLLIGWLNLVLTAPLIYLFIGLPLVLRQQGWSGADIGLLQLAGLPAMLKFLLAAPLDRWRLGRSPLARGAQGDDGNLPSHGTLSRLRQHIPDDRRAGVTPPELVTEAPVWLRPSPALAPSTAGVADA